MNLQREIPTRSRADLQAARDEEAGVRRRRAILTTVCLAGWLVGLLGETLGLLMPPAVLAVYGIAYLAGGSYSAVQAFRELRTGTVSVDLLMITAAAGAA